MNSEKCKSFFGKSVGAKKEEKDTLRSQRSEEEERRGGVWRHTRK
jgi:hypothetical protein